MNFEIQNFIEFINKLSGDSKNADYLKKISNIVVYMQSNDIVNGENYLSELLKDKEIEKNVIYRENNSSRTQTTYLQDKQISFIADCYAVIRAIGLVLIEKNLKDEYKDMLTPKLKTMVEIIDFFDDKILKQKE